MSIVIVYCEEKLNKSVSDRLSFTVYAHTGIIMTTWITG